MVFGTHYGFVPTQKQRQRASGYTVLRLAAAAQLLGIGADSVLDEPVRRTGRGGGCGAENANVQASSSHDRGRRSV